MSLTLGDFPLIVTADGGVTRETAHALAGSDLGNPEVIERAIAGWMRNGAIEWVEGYGNRSQSVLVMLQAGSPSALSDLEGQLWREVQRGRNTLTWTPAHPLAVTTVYRVQWAHLEFAWGETTNFDEFVTFWRLSLRCEPFAFSPTAVTSTAAAAPLPATPVVTTVDGCNYATPAAAVAAGWSGVTAAGGTSIFRTVDTGRIATTVTLTRTFASATNVGPVLRIHAPSTTSQAPMTVKATVGGVLVNLKRLQTLGDYHEFSAPSPVTKLAITGGYSFSGPGGGYLSSMELADVSKQDIVTPMATRRLNSHVLDVQGSSPTPATITLDAGGVAPGDCFLYAWDASRFGSYSPDVTRHRTGTVTVDSTILSGGRVDATSGTAYDVPTTDLPSGSYQVLARVKAATTAVRDVDISVQTVGWSDVVALPTAKKNIPNTWTWVRLGSVHLPTVRVSSGAAIVQRVTVTGDFEIDVLCLCLRSVPEQPGRTIGSLVIASNPDTIQTVITGADPSNPLPGVWRRTAAGIDVHAKTVQAFDPLIFKPGENALWVACSGADNGVEVTAEYHPAGHTTAPVVR